MFNWIKKHPQFSYAVSLASAKTIDKVNIRQANFKAMRQAIKKLSRQTGYKRFIVFVDGNDPIPGLKHPQYCFIKGDAKIFSLACASIMAKVSRDKFMERLSKKAPRYDFEIHKGYGTRLHYQKIKRHGVSAHHRKSFLR
jgi:ribonuclease HII